MRPTKSMLLAVSALAAIAALAPTPAMAVDDNPTAGECRAPQAGDTVVRIGTQLCAVDQGSGGNAGSGLGTGALPGGRQPGEVVWVTGEIPECLRNPARCLPGQIGGRGGRQEIGDGPGSGGPSGGGKGSGETKGRPSKEECDSLGKSGVLLPSVDKELARLDRQIDALRVHSEEFTTREIEMEREQRSLRYRLLDLGWWGPPPSREARAWGFGFGFKPGTYASAAEFLEKMQKQDVLKERLSSLKAEHSLLIGKINALRSEKERVRDEGERDTRGALRQCGAIHGR